MKKLILILIAALAPQLYAGGLPARSKKMDSKPKTETATLAGGCFWGVEDILRALPGVTETVVGYTGGKTDNPKYEDVKTGKTGHAESVEVVYDPGKISYQKLLEIFWSIHDPTTIDRQGPDAGSQYRSAIFYYTPDQKEEAIASKDKLERSKKHKNKIVTEISRAGEFYPAEDYHQDYFGKRGIKPACHIPGI